MATQPRKGFVRVEPRREMEPKIDAHAAKLNEPVTVPGPPTLEQCENLMHVMGLPTLPEGMRPPYYLESCRNLHALVVRTLNGDAEAERTLEVLKVRFGRAS